MEEALRNQEFCLHLQPQVDIQHGDALFNQGLLVRWGARDAGWSRPATSSRCFEHNRFIVDLDAFVFEGRAPIGVRVRAACLRLRLSVNVSHLEALRRAISSTVIQRSVTMQYRFRNVA